MFIKYITILSHKEHNSLTGYHHYSTFWIIHIFWLHFPFFGFNTFSPEHSMRISSTKCFAQKPFLSFKAILDGKVLSQFFLSNCIATIYDFLHQILPKFIDDRKMKECFTTKDICTDTELLIQKNNFISFVLMS